MIALIRRMWAAAPVATALMALALVVAVVFGTRAVNGYLYWHDPAHQDETIAGWMSPRYVATSWQVPPEVVGNALGLEKEKPRRLTLDQLAQERGVTLAALTTQIRAGIDAYRTTHPMKAP